MTYQMKKVAVIGSGVMGASIAAHLANVGLPVLLLDIVPSTLTDKEEAKGLTLQSRKVRNRLASEAVQRALKQKPAPFTTKRNASLIEVGNIEDDLEKIKDVDWVIEVVVERLDIKKSLYEKIEKYRRPGTIISSNTSGISIEAMAEGRSDDFKEHFLGTHFFNPPRYLKLLEIIPTSSTAPEVVKFMHTFGEDRLGKGVVIAKDTPNFIGNRIGTYGLLVTVDEMVKGGYSIGEVDSITGPLIGRPSSATFRTLDVVGLDVFNNVAKNVYDKTTGDEQKMFEIPAFMTKMLEEGRLGAKTKKGFYFKDGKEIKQLNLETFEYEPREKLKAPSLEQAKQVSRSKRLAFLLQADDRAGQFLWRSLMPTLLYAAELHGEIADDIVSIDQAMKWGFGWDLGPFEMWDAIGVEQSVERLRNEGYEIPTFVQNLLDKNEPKFYKEIDGDTYYFNGEGFTKQQVNPKEIKIQKLKKQNGTILSNSGASLIDIGDGVALLEFHSKSNAIGLDILQMIQKSVEEVEKNYKGLVIGNEGKNFCVGANLALILMEAQDDNLFELDYTVKMFQETMMKIKYSSRPVVAAPHGMTLGGGTEVCLPTAHIQASMETYMGLVEVGVGLLPGGGGNYGLLYQHMQGLPNGVPVDIQFIANKVFETIATAKVSTSAEEARELNFLRPSDGISVNADHRFYDAKMAALDLYERGYTAPKREKIAVTGASGYAALVLGAEAMKLSGYISEHDMTIAKHIAKVLSGGDLPFGTKVDPQYLLDLERQSFLQLLQQPKTLQRMQHMLLKGKPLRN